MVSKELLPGTQYGTSPGFTDRRLEVLTCIAQGYGGKGTARSLSISTGTVKQHLYVLHKNLDGASSLEVVLRTVEEGKIKAEDILGKFDPRSLSKLSRRELEVLEALTENTGQGSTNYKIGQKLQLAECSVRNHFTNIYDKLGERNRIKIGLAYLKFKSLREDGETTP